MKFNDFVDAILACGWQATCDAQHAQIRQLHAKMFPVIADLEAELFDAECELEDHRS